MPFELYSHQISALDKLDTGKILNGGVGSGKSLTSLAYYYLQCGGEYDFLTGNGSMNMQKIIPLYIITTPKKRNDKEWLKECNVFGFDEESIVVDSWNNIGKYITVQNAFFIFDEDKITGTGAWVHSFWKITKHVNKNQWIVLSATPGDDWTQYMPIFVANNFYKSKKHFNDSHVIFARYVSYPLVEKYYNTKKLMRLRDAILVNMPLVRKTTPHRIDILVDYNKENYKKIQSDRWNIYDDKPIENSSELCYLLRRVSNDNEDRKQKTLRLILENERIIIFYNFNYELDALRSLSDICAHEFAEYNGFNHDEIPKSKKWVYLVQYTSGAEGWNCIDTNVILFYSQNYSYKTVIQAAGRIDRLNTEYTDLYYYHLRSKSNIDTAIYATLLRKKKFNQSAYARRLN